MLDQIIRYYNQNRKKVFTIIIVVIFVLLIIQILNSIAKEANKNKLANNNSDKVVSSIPSNTNSDRIYSSDNQYNTNVPSVIENFISLCNDKNMNSAYNLISKNCKNNVFNNDINNFINNYYNKIFGTKKSYKIEEFAEKNSYVSYKVTFSEANLLATGGANTSNYEDVITITEENGTQKLNINGFIGENSINKMSTYNDITIKVNTVKYYRSYEVYNITIINNTSNTICISEEQNSNDIYAYNKNDSKLKSYIHEIPEPTLTIPQNSTQEINVKFGNIYDSSSIIKKLEFNNIAIYNGNNVEKTNIEITI